MLELSIFSRTWFALAWFVAFLILFHIFFVWLFPLSARAWKKADYIWLGVTALSLIAATAQVRKIEAANLLETFHGRWENADQHVLRKIQQAEDFECGLKFNKPEYISQADWDKLEEQQASTCQWMRDAKAAVEDELKKDQPELRQEILPSDQKVTREGQHQAIEAIRSEIDWRHQSFLDHKTLMSEARFSNGELALLWIWPLLLGFGFALRITKVTGELSL